MAVAALIVSIVAVSIGLVSLMLTLRADRRGVGTERRDERRLEMQAEDAAQRRRARPIAVAKGGSGGPTTDRVIHNYMVRNTGDTTGSEVALWIVDGKGATVSTRAGGNVTLAPNESAHFAVEVAQPRPDEQELFVSWRDPDGEHTESTGIR